MTSLEDLKSRLEALEFEKQCLEVDNLRLRTEQHDSLRELERYRGQLSPGHEGNEMETLQSDYQLLEMELSLARATLETNTGRIRNVSVNSQRNSLRRQSWSYDARS